MVSSGLYEQVSTLVDRAMQENGGFVRRSRLLALIASVIATLTGISVLVAWAFNLPFLICLRPGAPAMPPHIAIGLIIAGIGVLAIAQRQRPLASLLAILLVGWNVFILLIYTISFGVTVPTDLLQQSIPEATLACTFSESPDLLPNIAAFWVDGLYITVVRRPSPYAVLSFLLLGLSILWISRFKVRRRPSLVGTLLAVGSMAFSGVALLIYGSDLVQAYRWGQMTGMAIHTALCLFLLSVGVIPFALLGDRRRTGWLPTVVGMSGIIITVILSQAVEIWETLYFSDVFHSLQSEEQWQPVLPKLFFVSGVIVSTLLAVCLTLLERMERYVVRLRGTNRQYRREIQRRQRVEADLQEVRAELEARMEELQTLSDVKDDFLNTVSHELRTPISNIKMSTKMMDITIEQLRNVSSLAGNNLIEPIFEQLDRYFQILCQESDRELELINDLLDLQRLEAGRQPIVCEPIELNLWLPHVTDVFESRALDRQQRFQIDVENSLPTFYSDPACLDRIVTELLNNACKYTPPGEWIRLRVRAIDQQIMIEVRNSGIEIPAEALPHLFERFYRVPGGDRWKQGGTGLGLALIKHLISVLGGHIEAESEANQTCFRVYLPITGPPTPRPENE